MCFLRVQAPKAFRLITISQSNDEARIFVPDNGASCEINSVSLVKLTTGYPENFKVRMLVLKKENIF
jgi:hypothetical protein